MFHLKSKKNTQDAEALLKDLDKDNRSREFTGWQKRAYDILLIAYAVYVLAASLLLKSQTEYTKLPLFVGVTLFVGFLKFPACKRDAGKVNHIPWYDILLAAGSLVVYLYYVFSQNRIIYMGGVIGTEQVIFGIIGILLLAELCRRSTGIPLIVVVAAFIAYAVYTLYTRNPATALPRLLYDLFYNLDNGVFSTPVAVCNSFIIIFIIFGSFLERTGIGTFFVDLANSIAGSTAGGPAKVAVISSALEGMYSGSSVANTVGSGAITIPTMKRTGYRPEFAAAVEAAASTGGQIMPPIMGAAAFLMAQITGYAYASIIVAAILPAVLYFTGIFFMVHFEAKRLGLSGLPKETLPKFFHLMLKKGYLLIPIVVLVLCMEKYTASMSACFALLFAMAVSMLDEDTFEHIRGGKPLLALRGIVLALVPIGVYLLAKQFMSESTALFIALCAAVACSFLTKNAPLTGKTVAQGFMGGANSSVGVTVACGMAGIISGVVAATGLGSTLIALIVPIARNSIMLALILTMLCCIVLGMGVPTTANYVIMATITAPILVRMGIPLLAAHMFVFYFGIVADITPPVALAAYAGAAIAKANPLKTGVTATKLAIAAFLVPYIFVLNPAMLFIDTNVWQVIQIAVTSLAGIFGLAAGLEGYVFQRADWLARLLLIGGGIVLIIPETITDIIGLLVIAAVCAYQYMNRKKAAAAV